MFSNSMNARRLGEHRKYATKVPNFFVALKVPSPDIHKAVIDVQKSLCDANFNVSLDIVDVVKLHITLLVVHIENDEQLKDASTALDQCGVILLKKFTGTPVHLSFQGLSDFSNKVIFAKVVEDYHYLALKDMGNIVREEFSKMNITITDQRELNPHLTIARLLERPSSREQALLGQIFRKYQNYNFGSQVLSGLQLLRMSDDKDVNGYYIMEKQVSFNQCS